MFRPLLISSLALALTACSGPDIPPLPITPDGTCVYRDVQSPAQDSHLPRSTPPTITATQPAAPETATPPPPILASQKITPLAYHHTSRNGIVMSLVSYDDRQFQLQVADQANGPATHWTSAKSAAKAHRGVAAINGGFFTPQGKPLGLVITHGEKRGSLNRSSLGDGIYLSTKSSSKIIRRQSYTSARNRLGPISELLQTGPMLAEKGTPINGLGNTNNRPRSFLVWDGAHHWAIGYAESCSLHALSHALAGKAPAGFAIHSAVNLDGGRSSDLWVGPKVSNGNKSRRSFLNKPVRNFLVIVPK